MIKFFQILFFTTAIVQLVLNVIEFNKWQEGRKADPKDGNSKPHPIKWFPFILTSIVAIGCMLNIIFAYWADK